MMCGGARGGVCGGVCAAAQDEANKKTGSGTAFILDTEVRRDDVAHASGLGVLTTKK